MIPLILLVVILAVVAFYCVGIYNHLITLRNLYRNAFTQIDIQLKRRYDLIPNLVEAAKGYLAHERGTLEAVIKARNSALDASRTAAQSPGSAAAMTGLSQAEGALSGALSRLLAVVEAYPDLKANQAIANLMEELTSTENKISFARQAFNDAVTDYNIQREKFPQNVIASTFDFKAAALLEVVEKAEERAAPKVSFS
ncbi:MAG TPA: LemA family protein [Smithellaceae bacterium]|mgnify:FL=1|nr:LemA family protein [Smithellaceae bacterium]